MRSKAHERWLWVLLASAGACIIPDRDIRIESDLDNPGAVRIVEATPLLAEMKQSCAEALGSETELSNCPQVPFSLPQGLIRRDTFCSCPGRDNRTLDEFFIYAEDPDRRRDQPADTLYAVALLDLDPGTKSPQNYVAYPEHLTPGGAGSFIPHREGLGGTTPLQASFGREDNGLWEFRFGKDGGQGVDLCNDNNAQTLSVGLHNLQIMVTDRPFFQPTRLDAEGNEVLDPSGRPVLLPPQHGMPDLAAGATWAVANYVFSCEDPDTADCDCAEGAAP